MIVNFQRQVFNVYHFTTQNMRIEIVALITIIIVFVVANIIPAENASHSYYNVNLNNVLLCNKTCVCCSRSSYLYLSRGILMLEFLFCLCLCPFLMSHSKWFIVNHMCTYGISSWNFQHNRLRDDNCHSVVVLFIFAWTFDIVKTWMCLHTPSSS